MPEVLKHDLAKFAKYGNSILDSFRCDDSENIYHYTAPAAFLSIVEREELWFTDRFYLNDTTEGLYIFDLLIENMEDILKGTELEGREECLIHKCKAFKDHLPYEEFKVYQISFSTIPDSLPLWNYYTKGSSIQGYNLHFNSRELCNSISSKIIYKDADKMFLRGKIIYNQEQQLSILKDKIIGFYDALKAEGTRDIANIGVFEHFFEHVLDRFAVLGAFFKHPSFNVEKEYRICLYIKIENGQAPLLKYKNSKGEDKPLERCFREQHGLFVPFYKVKYDLDCLQGVWVSPTMDFEKVKQNINLLLEGKKKNKNFTIHKSGIPVGY